MLAALALVTIKATLLLAAAAIAAWSLRRASAASRHLVWATMFAGILVLAGSAPLPSPRSLRLEVAVPEAAAPVVAAWTPVPSVVPPESSFAWADAVVACWLAGAGIFLVRLAAAHVSLHVISARAHGIGSADGVRVIATDEIAVPATWGIIRPVIALPAGAAPWPAARRDAAIAHELAHVRRRDVLTQAAAETCCTLLWFHPGVWLASRRLRAECERACDDAVIERGANRLDYAETLLSLAARRPARGAGQMGAASGVRELEGRLRSILDASIRRGSPRSVRAAVPLVALLLTVALAGVQLRAGLLDPNEKAAFARLREASTHEKLHEADLIRERAVWALSVADGDRVIAPLIARLSDGDPVAREYAAWSLSIVGASQAVEPLRRCLGDPAWRVRAEAASALTALEDARATGEMIPLLSDPAWQVRFAAVEYLARFGGAQERAVIRERLNDAHVAVRTAAQTALGEI